MFKLRVADYINTNMLDRSLTYKDLARLSGVSDSSIHTYAQAKVNSPNEDNLIRIAAAFGDPPEVIQRMRRESMESSAKENKIIAESDDQQRMEEFAALMRTNMAAILEEYRLQSAAQQTEIIQHADKRIEEERARFKQRAEEVVKQCNEEIEKSKAHNSELMQLKDDLVTKGDDENERVRKYLKCVIRNLSIALIAVSAFAALGLAALGGYAFYAYHTFDREDPTRGLYRAEVTPSPVEDTILEEDSK